MSTTGKDLAFALRENMGSFEFPVYFSESNCFGIYQKEITIMPGSSGSCL
jgi:hypothetical protein